MRGARIGRSLRRASFVPCGLLVFVAACAHSGWKPAKNPNPNRILSEAQDDAAAGRFEDALAKHVWFHENALKYAPAMYGVRLSFALGYWATLGVVYPPAMQRLKAVRDEAGQDVRDGKNARSAFHDFASINRTLAEDAKTTETFIWLDASRPVEATQVFDIAQPALVAAKEYRLCGKYVDADRSYQRILSLYQEVSKINEENKITFEPDYQHELKEHAEKMFSNDVATLVALLVVNDRKVDAIRIAQAARKEWDGESFRQQLERAQNGEVPAPWP